MRATPFNIFILIIIAACSRVFSQNRASEFSENNTKNGETIGGDSLTRVDFLILSSAQNHERQKQFDSCIYYAELFIDLPVFQTSYNVKKKVNFLKWLAGVYDKNGEPKRGYERLLVASRLNDSLMRSETGDLESGLLQKYETLEKQTKISALSFSTKIQEEELRLTKNRRYAYVSGVIFLIFCWSFFWLYNINKRKKDRLLYEKKQVIFLLEGQETERQRIASDLNDRLGGMLATVKLYFNAFEENTGQLRNRGSEHYLKANDLLDEACNEVRKIAFDLASGVLVKLGLIPALHDLKDTVNKTGKVKLSILIFGLKQRLPAETEVSLFRIIQELLTNSVRHGHSKNVTLQLNESEGNLNLTFEDDGNGFDINDSELRAGIGLRNMEERVKNLHGTCFIDSHVGKGTTVVIDVPVNVT